MFCMGADTLRAELKKLLSRKKGRMKTVVATMDHEVGWRLQKIANLWGVPQGAIVQILCEETVKQFRLPYETFGRDPIWGTSASESVMAGGETGEKGEGETLPITQALTSSECDEGVPTLGAGEGEASPPAPVVPQPSATRAPSAPRKGRKAG